MGLGPVAEATDGNAPGLVSIVARIGTERKGIFQLSTQWLVIRQNEEERLTAQHVSNDPTTRLSWGYGKAVHEAHGTYLFAYALSEPNKITVAGDDAKG